MFSRGREREEDLKMWLKWMFYGCWKSEEGTQARNWESTGWYTCNHTVMNCWRSGVYIHTYTAALRNLGFLRVIKSRVLSLFQNVFMEMTPVRCCICKMLMAADCLPPAGNGKCGWEEVLKPSQEQDSVRFWEYLGGTGKFGLLS